VVAELAGAEVGRAARRFGLTETQRTAVMSRFIRTECVAELKLARHAPELAVEARDALERRHVYLSLPLGRSSSVAARRCRWATNSSSLKTTPSLSPLGAARGSGDHPAVSAVADAPEDTGTAGSSCVPG
jgi:hypothetical protein